MQLQSPTSLPKDLTKTTSIYKLKVGLAVIAIILFFSLFASFVAGSIWLLYAAIIFPFFMANVWIILLKIGSILGAGMLVLFLFKFLLKLKNSVPENRVAVTVDQEPKLWALVNEICTKTGAPMPVRIYLDTDVNAYVRYSNTWLSLIFPVRKELTIGMPLFYTLNTSEMQAVISHEFGHFAQRSMRVGNYVGTANTIIHDMIYNRDKWDETLVQWRSQDLRIALPALVLSVIIFVIRHILMAFYWLLNVLNSSMSREMEFNADKYAVSTTGSIPLISGIWKLEIIQNVWSWWQSTAYQAHLKDIHTNNLFPKFQTSWTRNEASINTTMEELPVDPKGGKQFFIQNMEFKASMYASHPSSYDRETNAKTPFVEAPMNRTVSLCILTKPEESGSALTKIVYKLFGAKEEQIQVNEEAFSHFVTSERLTNILIERYQNTFIDRVINLPSKIQLKEQRTLTVTTSYETVTQHISTLNELIAPLLDLNKQLELAQGIQYGTTKSKFIDIDGKQYHKKQLPEAFEILVAKRKHYVETGFRDWDRQLCLYLMHISIQKSEEKSFLVRIEQQRVINQLLLDTTEIYGSFMQALGKLQEKGEVHDFEIKEFSDRINKDLVRLNEQLNELIARPYEPIPNLPDVSHLHKTLTNNEKLPYLSQSPFENGDFNQFYTEYDHFHSQLWRVYHLNLSALFTMGENVLED